MLNSKDYFVDMKQDDFDKYCEYLWEKYWIKINEQLEIILNDDDFCATLYAKKNTEQIIKQKIN